jgi:hypothetical protein
MTRVNSVLRDGPAPCAGFHAAPFDQVLEALQIAYRGELSVRAGRKCEIQIPAYEDKKATIMSEPGL